LYKISYKLIIQLLIFTNMNVIKNIKTIREQKGYSQDVIANALELDNAVVSNLENGKRKLKFDELEKIANALEVDMIYLITYPDVYVKKSDSTLNDSLPEYGLSDKDRLIKSQNDRIRFQENLINELLTKIK